jgi:Ca2+-binding EF-hand superfamily protein
MSTLPTTQGARHWRAGLVLVVLSLLTGCGGSKNPLASASPTDKEFVVAASTWDLDHDGNITCDEWKRYAAGLFKDADANHDGALSRAEFAAMARVDRLFETVGFAYFDADRDGRVTLSELVDKPNPAFALLDKDNDCVISQGESVRTPGGSSGSTGRTKTGRRRGGGL